MSEPRIVGGWFRWNWNSKDGKNGACGAAATYEEAAASLARYDAQAAKDAEAAAARKVIQDRREQDRERVRPEIEAALEALYERLAPTVLESWLVWDEIFTYADEKSGAPINDI